jgi:hypothetical protein
MTLSHALRAGSRSNFLEKCGEEWRSDIARVYARLSGKPFWYCAGSEHPGLVQRTKNKDLDMMCSAVIIQRQSGGNLAMNLENITETINQRIRLRGEIMAMTSAGRLSGYIIGALPVFTSFCYVRKSRDGICFLRRRPQDHAAGFGGFGSDGFAIGNKIVISNSKIAISMIVRKENRYAGWSFGCTVAIIFVMIALLNGLQKKDLCAMACAGKGNRAHLYDDELKKNRSPYACSPYGHKRVSQSSKPGGKKQAPGRARRI